LSEPLLAPEETTEDIGDGEDQVPVGDGSEDLLSEPLREEGRTLVLTRPAVVSGLAGECEKVLCLAEGRSLPWCFENGAGGASGDTLHTMSFCSGCDGFSRNRIVASAESLARDGIGHWAHVGGFAFGAGVAVVIMVFGNETRLWKRSERLEENGSPEEMEGTAAPAQPAEPPAAEAPASKDSPPPLLLADPGELMTLFQEAERALRSRRLQQARELFTRALSHPTCTDVWRERVEARLAEIDQASRFGQFPD